MDQLELRARAKINLGLDILGKRADGYHEIRTVMQTLRLSDHVRIEKTAESGIFLETNLSYLPVGDKNLAYRAADLLRQKFALCQGVHITLQKHIPVAAGLAGGSADAAAVLYGMNRLFQLGLTETDLQKIGSTLGADVPYCLLRGTVLAEGVGEQLTPLPPLPACYVLLAKPSAQVSTREVYEKWDRILQPVHPDLEGLLQGLEKQDLLQVAQSLGNGLEDVTQKEVPSICTIKTVMRDFGALNALMSGSGPTVFGLYTDRQQAQQAAGELQKRQLARQVFVTTVYRAGRRL